MKRLVILVLVLSLALSGCMARTVVKNVLAGADKVLCDPTIEQVAEAVQALSFLQTAGSTGAAVASAISVFRNIRDRVCVAIPQLQAALDTFDATAPPLKLTRIAAGYVKPELKALRRAVQ